LEYTKSGSFWEFLQNSAQFTVSIAKSVDFMKDIIKLRVMLESSLSRIAKDIGHDGFFMEILASLTIGAVASLVILLAGLSLILNMGQDLSLKFISSMSEAALVAKLAFTLKFPVLAHFSLVLSLVVLNKETSFFSGSEVLLLRLNINLKGRAVYSTVSRVDAARSRDVSSVFGIRVVD